MKFIYGILIICITSTLTTAALILSDLIKNQQIDQAKNLSLVDPTLFLNRTSHSGYFTVDAVHKSNLFFWYIPAEVPKPNSPWIIWLQGGPGATSLAGLFDEIGPFYYNKFEEKLKPREWSWAKDHSLVFIDNPVGSGYSFTHSLEGYVKDMVTCSSHLYSFLRQFLTVFPELRKAPLYIAGESYAGRYIPPFATKILEHDPYFGFLKVNLQGIILGNPVMSHKSVYDYGSMYYHWGLIDDQGLMAVKPLQDQYLKAMNDNNPLQAAELRNTVLDKVETLAARSQSYNVIKDNVVNDLEDFEFYLRKPEVRKALHVEDIEFSFRNSTVSYNLKGDFLSDVEGNVEKLLNENIRILIYCGQLDLMAPCVSSARARRKNWHWNQRDQFIASVRKPWSYNNTIAGYVKSGGGFTEVLVRNAGHLAPMDKPAQVTQLITYFTQHRDLDLPPNYKVPSLPKTSVTSTVEEFDDFLKSPYLNPTSGGKGVTAGMIVSIVFNVIFVIILVCGVVFFWLWKRRTVDNMIRYASIEEANVNMSSSL